MNQISEIEIEIEIGNRIIVIPVVVVAAAVTGRKSLEFFCFVFLSRGK